jgi:hypothetical protein
MVYKHFGVPRASDIQLEETARETRGNRTRLKARDVAVLRYEARIYIRDLFKYLLAPTIKVLQDLEQRDSMNPEHSLI